MVKLIKIEFKNSEVFDISKVQSFLSRNKSWKDYVDSQKFGDCEKICKRVLKKFPEFFDSFALDLSVNYDKDVMDKVQDGESSFGNHYVLTRGGVIYDFAKGANSINNHYLLSNNPDDKYSVTWTPEERSKIFASYKRKLFY